MRHPEGSTATESILRIVFGLALAAAILAQLGLLFRADSRFLERPQIEDSYYAFSVSRSIAEGRGFSIDGVHSTNGVQPLICLLYAPIFALFDGDPVTPLRGVLLLNLLTALLGAYLFSRFVHRLLPEEIALRSSTVTLIAVAGFLVNYSLATHLLNGLETGLTLSLLLMIFIRWGDFRSELSAGEVPGLRSCVRIGLLLGIAGLSRIDTLILGVPMAIDLYMMSRHMSSARRLALSVGRAGIIAIMALLVTLPWWLYNLTEFGHVLPVSGQSQADLAGSRIDVIQATLNVVGDAMIPGLHTPAGWGLAGWAFFGLLIPIALLLVPPLRRVASSTLKKVQKAGSLHYYRLPLLYAGLLTVAYTFFFGAPHFQPRYLILLQVLGLCAWVLYLVTSVVDRKQARGAGRWVVPGVSLLYLAVNLFFFTRFYDGSYNNPLLQTIEWIGERTTSGEKIGVFQSGTSEYFFPDRVTNLDGKVNPAAHREFRRGRLGSYVDSLGFDYIIDWPLYTDRIFKASPTTIEYVPIDTLANHMIVWKRTTR